MNTWSKAWLKSLGVHLLIAVIVAGASYISFLNKDMVPKGVRVSIGGGNKGGHGQGGRYKTIASGTNIPTQDSLEQKGAKKHTGKVDSSNKQGKKRKDKTKTPVTTERATSYQKSVDDEAASGTVGSESLDQSSNDAEQSDVVGSSAGVLASNGMGSADFGTSYGNGGDGNGYGTGSGPFDGTGFYRNGDGSYTATSPDGLDFEILREIYPPYPEEAKEVKYTRIVVVEAKLLVGLDGSVESVQILNSPPNLGFREATIRALRGWQFSPIKYQGYPIKVEFTKRIRFIPN